VLFHLVLDGMAAAETVARVARREESMMNLPKLLLLVNGPASESGIGGIFLNDLCSFYPSQKLCRFSTTLKKTPGPKAHLWDGRPVQYFPVTVSTLPILSSITDRIFQRTEEAQLIAEAVRFGRNNSVEAVWGVLNSSYMVRIALAVANALNVPLYTTVWDPPDSFRINMHLSRRRYDDIHGIFQQTLRKSTSVSVIGESMAKQYAQELGVCATPIAHGYPTAAYLPGKTPFADGKVKIGFAGSLYAKQEWRALIRALEFAKLSIAGRPVELHFIGRCPFRGAPMPDYVIKHGVLSPDETLNRLRGVDIGYLPYWFNRRHENIARLAFPSKSAVYLAAGCRIFYHGPQYGSPTAFLSKYQVGAACHTLDLPGIVETLELLAQDAKGSSHYSDERARACKEMISREAMIEHFATFLRCSVSDLNIN